MNIIIRFSSFLPYVAVSSNHPNFLTSVNLNISCGEIPCDLRPGQSVSHYNNRRLADESYVLLYLSSIRDESGLFI